MALDLNRAVRDLQFGGPYVRYFPGWVLPRTFDVTWDDATSPIVRLVLATDDDGRPHCVGITVTGRAGSDVTGTELREVAVARLIGDAVAYAVMPEGKPGQPVGFKTLEDFRAFRQLQPRHHARERWQLTDDHLREVVEVYGLGRGAGVMAVAEHFNRPRATASRWVVEARRRGFFDEVKTKPAKRPGKRVSR